MLKKIRALPTEDKVNYFLCFGLIGVSGMPYFFGSIYNVLMFFMVSLFIFLKRSIRFDTRSLNIMGVFFLVELLQAVFVYSIAPVTYMGTVLRFMFAYVVVAICNKKFIIYYVNILYFLAVVSFVFYIPTAFIPGVYDFFVSTIAPLFPAAESSTDNPFYAIQSTIVIFTLHPTLLMFRHPGAFWEPGAYAIFLNLALIFNIIITGKLVNKKNVLFIIAIISTLSTTGFVAMFILIASFFLVTGELSKKAFILIMFAPLAIYLFFTLDFLGSKISQNMELKDDTTSRFGSAAADLEDFSTSPLIGWGKGEKRFGGKEFTFFTVDQHRNNGLTNLLATYGIFAFLTLLYNYLKTFNALCSEYSFTGTFAFLCFLIMMMMGFGESIFQYPFFFSIMFLHLAYTKHNSITVR